MKTVQMTCPFTGSEFTALEFEDGTLSAKNVITGETVKIRKAFGNYVIPENAFEYTKTVTFKQAALILDVSKQRISQLVRNGTIPIVYVEGGAAFKLSDVIEYKETRKVGRPRKD